MQIAAVDEGLVACLPRLITDPLQPAGFLAGSEHPQGSLAARLGLEPGILVSCGLLLGSLHILLRFIAQGSGAYLPVLVSCAKQWCHI